MDDRYSFKNPPFWLILGAVFLISLMLGAALWQKEPHWRALVAVVCIPASFVLWWWLKSGSEAAFNLAIAGFGVTVVGQLWVLFKKDPIEPGTFALAAFYVAVLGLFTWERHSWLNGDQHRRKKARRILDARDGELRRRLLQMIESHARSGEHELLYVKTGQSSPSPDAAKIGGSAAAVPGSAWPLDRAGKPAIFLLQLTLQAPRLPEPWQGRLLTMFYGDRGVQVTSHEPKTSLVSLHPPEEQTEVAPYGLQAVAIPYMPPSPAEADVDFTDLLLDRVPGLREELRRHTSQPTDLLEALLANADDDFLEEYAVFSGGEPRYQQRIPTLDCPDCGSPLRFLMQFGDVAHPLLFEKVGAYVYGCDTHPHRCVAHLD